MSLFKFKGGIHPPENKKVNEQLMRYIIVKKTK